MKSRVSEDWVACLRVCSTEPDSQSRAVTSIVHVPGFTSHLSARGLGSVTSEDFTAPTF